MRRQSESVTDFTDLKFLMDTLVRLLGADLSILSKFTKIFWGDYSRQLLFLFFVGGTLCWYCAVTIQKRTII